MYWHDWNVGSEPFSNFCTSPYKSESRFITEATDFMDKIMIKLMKSAKCTKYTISSDFDLKLRALHKGNVTKEHYFPNLREYLKEGRHSIPKMNPNLE